MAPNLNDGSRGIRLKIEWAKQHIHNLDDTITAFLGAKPGPYEVVPKEQPEIGHIAFCVNKTEPVPSPIPLIAGDAIHNLRSALDHIVFQLAGCSSTSRVEFPICQSAKSFDAAIKGGKVKGVESLAVRAIRACQPYETGDMTLWGLAELDRIDKHRVIVTTAASFRTFGLKKPKIVLIEDAPWYPLNLGEYIVSIPADTYAQHKDNFSFGFDVVLCEPKIFAGKSLFETLKRMADIVESLVSNFTPLT